MLLFSLRGVLLAGWLCGAGGIAATRPEAPDALGVEAPKARQQLIRKEARPEADEPPAGRTHRHEAHSDGPAILAQAVARADAAAFRDPNISREDHDDGGPSEALNHAVEVYIVLEGVPRNTFDAMPEVNMRMLTRIRELINAHLKEWMSASHHVVTEKTPGLFRVGVDVGSAGEFCEGHRKGAGNEDDVAVLVRVQVASLDDGNHVLSYLLKDKNIIAAEVHELVHEVGGRALKELREDGDNEKVHVRPNVFRRFVDNATWSGAKASAEPVVSVVFRVFGVRLEGKGEDVACKRKHYEEGIHEAFHGVVKSKKRLAAEFDHKAFDDMVRTELRCSMPSEKFAEVAMSRLKLAKEHLAHEVAIAVKRGLEACGEHSGLRVHANVDEPALRLPEGHDDEKERSEGSEVRVVLETTGVADTITGPSRAADFRKELSEYTREVLRGHGGPHLFEGKDEQVWTVWRHNDTILETRYRIVVPDHAHAVSMRDGWEATGSNTSEQVHRWLAARVGEVDRVKDKPLESHFAKALIKESDVAQDDVSDVSKAWRVSLVLDIANISWQDLLHSKDVWKDFDDAIVEALHDAGNVLRHEHKRYNKPGEHNNVLFRIDWAVGKGPKGKINADKLRDKLEQREAQIVDRVQHNIREHVKTDLGIYDMTLGRPHTMFLEPPHIWSTLDGDNDTQEVNGTSLLQTSPHKKEAGKQAGVDVPVTETWVDVPEPLAPRYAAAALAWANRHAAVLAVAGASAAVAVVVFCACAFGGSRAEKAGRAETGVGI